MTKSQQQRLDQALVQLGHFPTRSRARDAIARGTVSIGGVVVTKPSHTFAEGAVVEIADPAQAYVSRAALKLVAGLDHFSLRPEGLDCLDIGASTGGFTQVLLERSARHVTAVDVGHDQLHAVLRNDIRVTNCEGLNAREMSAEDLAGRAIRVVVSDVSFISLRLALPPALALAESGAFCVLLVKPQFEAGRDAIGKGGLLKDPSQGPRIAQDLGEWLAALPGWSALGIIPSPIQGGDGNQEFLLAGQKQ
jgi:23S rRNA (cytidine1920-2'-O)/16S rRNA (cytidine1409-2'-O)-methyltransferase